MTQVHHKLIAIANCRTFSTDSPLSFYDNDINFDNNDSKLHRTCSRGYSQELETLLKTPQGQRDVNTTDLFGQTPLMLSTTYDPTGQSTKTLLQHNAEQTLTNTDHTHGANALHMACEASNTPAVNAILDTPTGQRMINTADGDGWTPLMFCASNDTSGQTTRTLIQHQANVAIAHPTAQRNTALHIAAGKGNIGATRAILETPAGQALINQHNHWGETPSDIAILSDKWNPKVITLLLSKKGIFSQTEVDTLPLEKAQCLWKNGIVTKGNPRLKTYDDYETTLLQYAWATTDTPRQDGQDVLRESREGRRLLRIMITKERTHHDILDHIKAHPHIAPLFFDYLKMIIAARKDAAFPTHDRLDLPDYAAVTKKVGESLCAAPIFRTPLHQEKDKQSTRKSKIIIWSLYGLKEAHRGLQKDRPKSNLPLEIVTQIMKDVPLVPGRE